MLGDGGFFGAGFFGDVHAHGGAAGSKRGRADSDGSGDEAGDLGLGLAAAGAGGGRLPRHQPHPRRHSLTGHGPAESSFSPSGEWRVQPQAWPACTLYV